MDNAKKQELQDKELHVILSRIEHVLEHGPQDDNLVAAAIFQLFIEIVTEIDDKEYEVAIQQISRLRKERIKLKKESE